MPEFKCIGCDDFCSTSWPKTPTGCHYEDSEYPRDARIWFLKEIAECYKKDREYILKLRKECVEKKKTEGNGGEEAKGDANQPT